MGKCIKCRCELKFGNSDGVCSKCSEKEQWCVVVKDNDEYVVFAPFNDMFHAKEYAENQNGDDVEIAQIIKPIYERG